MVGRGIAELYDRRDAIYPFEAVSPILRDADVVFGNLEASFRDLSSNLSRLERACACDPSIAARLRETGFTVVSVANNHSLQHGAEIFTATVATLERLGVQAVGLCGHTHKYCQPVDVVVRGLPLRLLAYSLRPRQYFREEPLYAEPEESTIIADVAKGASCGRIVVVSIHWGDEFSPRPSYEHVNLGRDLIDAGARIVIGHHPHVLQGWERRGAGVILYSLGNFVADISWNAEVRRSVVADLKVDENSVVDVTLHPIVVGRDFAPMPATGKMVEDISSFLSSERNWIEGHQNRWDTATDRRYRRRLKAALYKYRLQKYIFTLKTLGEIDPDHRVDILKRFITSRLAGR